MKRIVPIMVLYFAASVFAQERPKPVLVDEFERTGCDEMLARVDNFHIQLQNNITARGLVVVSGSNDNLVKKLSLEVLFTSGTLQRRLATSRVSLIHGPETGEATMRFWLIPLGAEDPVSSTAWSIVLPAKSKPFAFFSDNDAICIYPTVHKYIKQILVANPTTLLNVVVNNGNQKEFRRLRRETIETYGREYSRRLRFFSVKNRYPDTFREYWIIPKKK